MNDIIEQCGDHILPSLERAHNEHQIVRAVLIKFKELTAEPTDAMVYVGAYEVSDFLLEDEKAIACFKSMTEQMWKEIGI